MAVTELGEASTPFCLFHNIFQDQYISYLLHQCNQQQSFNTLYNLGDKVSNGAVGALYEVMSSVVVQ